jgi:hypothetical protein
MAIRWPRPRTAFETIGPASDSEGDSAWVQFSRSPVLVFVIATATLGLVMLTDALTPFELGFSAFYVLPVLIAAWGLGLSRGLGFAIVSACCWYSLDLASGRPVSHEFFRVWDALNHLLSYSLIAIITGILKKAFLRERELRIDRDQALRNVHDLEGLLPVCAWCKRIRDDEGYWQELEAYLKPRTKASFSHGICPACVQILIRDSELESQ